MDFLKVTNEAPEQPNVIESITLLTEYQKMLDEAGLCDAAVARCPGNCCVSLLYGLFWLLLWLLSDGALASLSTRPGLEAKKNTHTEWVEAERLLWLSSISLPFVSL